MNEKSGERKTLVCAPQSCGNIFLSLVFLSVAIALTLLQGREGGKDAE
jgi:hypothetical protein